MIRDNGSGLLSSAREGLGLTGMRERVRMIRSLEAEFARPVGILVDLQGPKLRIGTFADGAALLSRAGLDRLSAEADAAPDPALKKQYASNGFARCSPKCASTRTSAPSASGA